MTRSVKGAAKRTNTADSRARKAWANADSFQNFAANLGIGTDNLTTMGSYGFNPITRIRQLLEWIHRGTWIGGLAIDIPADDMTREGIEHLGELDPDDIEKLEEAATTIGLWDGIRDTIAWSRLYGGALAVMLIDGQRPETPLQVDRIGKGQFKGLLVLDRWQVEPSLNDLITELGPNLGKPKFYTIVGDAPAMPRMKIHYSRCLRLEGERLPYWQRLTENLWGESVLERIYDRMQAFDSATTGAAQLLYKIYLRILKVKKLREIVGQGKVPLANLTKYVNFMRQYQTNEGITMIDADDEMTEAGSGQALSGMSDLLLQFGQQLSGGLQVPLIRLFGQSPAGLNSSGESDMRIYYDGILQKQNKSLLTPVTIMYRVLALSEGIDLPEGYKIKFKPLWQLSDSDKATIASTGADAISKAQEIGISQQAALKELRQLSRVCGYFSNITAEDIDAADDQPPPSPNEAAAAEAEAQEAANAAKTGGKPGEPDPAPSGQPKPPAPTNGAAAEH